MRSNRASRIWLSVRARLRSSAKHPRPPLMRIPTVILAHLERAEALIRRADALMDEAERILDETNERLRHSSIVGPSLRNTRSN